MCKGTYRHHADICSFDPSGALEQRHQTQGQCKVTNVTASLASVQIIHLL